MPWYYYDEEKKKWEASPTYKHNVTSRWFADGTSTYLIEQELAKQPTTYPIYRTTYEPYVPKKPWDGVDKSKWPSTFAWLVMFYYQPSYHTDTRYKHE